VDRALLAVGAAEQVRAEARRAPALGGHWCRLGGGRRPYQAAHAGLRGSEALIAVGDREGASGAAATALEGARHLVSR
jgi:hypothetical protein